MIKTIDELLERVSAGGTVAKLAPAKTVNSLHWMISGAWHCHTEDLTDLHWRSADAPLISQEWCDEHNFSIQDMLEGGFEPTGLWAELAGMCLAFAATICINKWELQAETFFHGEVSMEDVIAMLHYGVADLLDKSKLPIDWHPWAAGRASTLLQYSVFVAHEKGVDLLDLCETVLTYFRFADGAA